ncbi:MAG: T9SS type A sorting domain-containing protein [Spirosomaceae bacterium]|nr:T9SS type A sorting domain-containing protein [Spirosomataceae bacterium]
MKTFITFCLALGWAWEALATHLVGGEISVRRISAFENTYEIYVNLYMNHQEGTLATDAQNTISLCMGTTPNETVTVTRRSFTKIEGTAVSLSQYVLLYPYATPGTYTISMTLENRRETINIPNSVGRVFSLKTTFSTFSNNQTPVFTRPAYIEANLGQTLRYSASGTDPDGDSLVYKITRPLEGIACNIKEINNYLYPNEITRRGIYRIIGRTGELTWNAPTQTGLYAASVTVEEWRRGVKISETQREIMVNVQDKGGMMETIPPFETPVVENQIITAIETTSEASLRVFPSPAQHEIKVSCQTQRPLAVQFQLIDTQGRIQQTFQEKIEQLWHQHTFDTQSLPAGTYIVRVLSDRVLSQKVVKE